MSSKTVFVVNDKISTGKEKGHLTKFTLTDTDGKVMKAGMDYKKEVVYTYAEATTLANGESRKKGEAVRDSDIVPAGTAVNVTITGTGSYQGTVTGEYRVIAKKHDISKAKIKVKPQYYTGLLIEPGKDQFEIMLVDKPL